MKNMPALPIILLISAGILAACGGGGGSSGGSASPPVNATVQPPPSPGLHAADRQSAHADVLADCVLAESAAESCTLTTLPLIGQEITDPSIDDILARTVVSDDWMSTRLREALEILPADIRSLMKAVTAVVIDRDIRPSFYSPRTGAIYIDPAYLWLTNAEKDTVAKDPDYRADFGIDLRFVSLYRYIFGTQYAWQYYDLDGGETRTVRDIHRLIAALLFHELAHANDAFPPVEISRLDNTLSVAAAADSIAHRRISAQLAAFQPLNSQLMLDLAEVLYLGEQATNTQLQLTAAQVGLEFEGDGASDDYAYSADWEDLAMLFEEVMMRHHFNVDREVAYTNMPAGSDVEFCDSYVIAWGARNRVGDPLVKSRAEFGLQLLLDTADVSRYLDGLPDQWRMTNGRDWCAIQFRGNGSTGGATGRSSSTLESADHARQRIRPDALDIGYR